MEDCLALGRKVRVADQGEGLTGAAGKERLVDKPGTGQGVEQAIELAAARAAGHEPAVQRADGFRGGSRRRMGKNVGDAKQLPAARCRQAFVAGEILQLERGNRMHIFQAVDNAHVGLKEVARIEAGRATAAVLGLERAHPVRLLPVSGCRHRLALESGIGGDVEVSQQQQQHGCQYPRPRRAREENEGEQGDGQLPQPRR
jgi:hypothetical protein